MVKLLDKWRRAMTLISPTIVFAAVILAATPAMADSYWCGSDDCRCTTSSCGVAAPLQETFPSVIVSEDRSWHLLTQTYGGTVSLLKDLTQHECEFAMHRAKGEPATGEERAAEAARIKHIQDDYADWKHRCKTGQFSIEFGDCEGNGGGFYSSNEMHTIGPGDIKSAECFQ
jgi:hypothetical protein